jgi:hypothetical protein
MNSDNYANTYDIFISYRREGGETMAILLHDRLKAKGYSVFLDVESLNAGKFNSQLLKVIENCKDVIVVLSENSLDRCVNEEDWVRKELVHAFEKRKNIIPFMLRGFSWPENLPDDISELPLQNGVNANSNEYFDASIERLITKFLCSKPRSSFKKPKVFIPALALIAVACIAAAIMLRGSAPLDEPEPESVIPVAIVTPENPPEAPQYVEEILNEDYSGRVVNRTLSANHHGIAALRADGTVITHDMNGDLSGWTDIVSISVGGSHVLGLKADGTVVAMGSNEDGQCDVAGWKDIISIEAGHYYSIGIRRNGTVVLAGFRFPYLDEINALRDVIMVSGGMHNIAALKADGTVQVVGSDSRGEHLTSGWSDIIAIASGDFFTLGIKSDGTVVWAGEHDYSSDLNDWYNIKEVVIGRDIIGAKADGTVIATSGENISGIDVISGWRDIISIALGWNNLIGLKSDGTVVYTVWFTFDDITELAEWSGIAS